MGRGDTSSGQCGQHLEPRLEASIHRADWRLTACASGGERVRGNWRRGCEQNDQSDQSFWMPLPAVTTASRYGLGMTTPAALTNPPAPTAAAIRPAMAPAAPPPAFQTAR